MEGLILCHLCHGKMNCEGVILTCSKCGHQAEMILPPSEAEQLFKEELEYKLSVSKRGGSSKGRANKSKPKRGIPWYDIDRISAEGCPGQGFRK
jgi:hypothetical protein